MDNGANTCFRYWHCSGEYLATLTWTPKWIVEVKTVKNCGSTRIFQKQWLEINEEVLKNS